MAAQQLVSKLVCEQCGGGGVRLAALADDLGFGPAALCPGCGGGGIVSRRDVRLLAELAADDVRGLLTRIIGRAAQARQDEEYAASLGEREKELIQATVAYCLESVGEALRNVLLPPPPRKAKRIPVAA